MMLSITSQAAMNHRLLDEVANSGAISDPVLFIHAALLVFAVATLVAGYLFFGRTHERTSRP